MAEFIELDGRPYVVEPNSITRNSANQMAAKVGQGSGKYDDLLIWDATLWDNWQAGVGKRDPSAGGFLMSTAETRFENQISMPLSLHDVNVTDSGGTDGIDSVLVIGDGQTYTKTSTILSLNSGQSSRQISVLLPGSNYQGTATQAKVEIWSSTAGSPNAMLQSVTVSLLADLGYFWHLVQFTNVTTGSYHVVVYPVSGTMSLIHTSTLGRSGHRYNGVSWSAASGVPFFYHLSSQASQIDKLVGFNSKLYAAVGANLYNTADWSTILYTFGATITDLLAVGDTLFVGLGNSTNYQTMNTSESFTAGSVPARLFALWKGFLYRAVSNGIYYTANETNWVGPLDVCYSKYAVRGMAGFGNDLYIACDDGLYRLAPGNIVESVHRFPTVDSTNGQYMTNWQGQLYLNLKQSLIRFDGQGFLPMGLDLGDGLKTGWSGNVTGIQANNNWLTCTIAGATYSSVWCHNGQGWHCVLRLPKSATVSCSTYAAAIAGGASAYLTHILAAGTTTGAAYYVRLPDTGQSVYRQAQENVADATEFEASASFEQDRFEGGLPEIYKDIESVYVAGDGLSATSYADVYWQDEDSADWEFLGTVNTGSQELRWSNSATRPNSRWIKLKFVLTNLSYASTPRITAIRLKFQNMVIDRFRWTIPVEVSSEQQMIDGDRNWYNHDEQLEHLDSLLTQVPPWIYTDTDGLQYEVKTLTHTRQPRELQLLQDGTTEIPYQYTLVIEQCNSGVYDDS